MSLVQLIYISAAVRELAADEIRPILDASIKNNGPAGITGMLLYSEGSFMQVLEGEETTVEALMSKIAKDSRHQDIVVLSREPIEARDFGSWSMSFRGLNAQDARSWPGFAPFFEFGFNAERFDAKPGLAIDLLKNFRWR